MAADEREEEEPIAYVISHGRIADFLRRLSRPVFAWPGRSLYRVVLHGHGFVLRLEGLPPKIGFYITYFVAARNVRAAEAKALQRLNDRWETFYDDATGQLLVEVEEVEELDARFLMRSRYGLAFYYSDD